MLSQYIIKQPMGAKKPAELRYTPAGMVPSISNDWGACRLNAVVSGLVADRHQIATTKRVKRLAWGNPSMRTKARHVSTMPWRVYYCSSRSASSAGSL